MGCNVACGGRHLASGVLRRGSGFPIAFSSMGLRGGRGSRGGPARLEPETAAYFQRVLETLQEGLSAEEMGERTGGCGGGFGSLGGGLGLRAGIWGGVAI